MPFFGFFARYDKPGPGVRKDRKPKAPPVRFFQLLGRRMSKLVQLNMIFFLPAAVTVVCMTALNLSNSHLIMRLPDDAGGLRFDTWSPFMPYPPGAGNGEIDGMWLDVWAGFISPLPLVTLAPFMAGLTLVTRNFVREEYAFVWSDFWQGVQNNWKTFLLNGVVCYLFYVVLTVSVLYYCHLSQSRPFFYVPLWLCIMLVLLFVFAQFYLPLLFVTFDLTFGQAWKNALIFAVVGGWRNLLLAVILGVSACIVVLLLATVNLVIFLPLCGLILFSFLSLLINFTVYPVVYRYLIQPYEKAEGAGEMESKK